jgi:transcriptional regulator with XRE-family HTH domain
MPSSTRAALRTAAWLRTRMAALDISSLEDLAQRSGLDRGTIYRYFNRQQEPGAHNLQPLCEALEADAEELLRALGYWR